MNNDIIKDESGNIKTGANTSVNPKFISEEGTQMAKAYASSNPSTNAINASRLGEAPIAVPNIKESTVASGITGAATGILESSKNLLAEATKAKETAGVAKEDTKSAILSKLSELAGVQESRGQVEDQFGVNKKLEAYNDITNRLEASQRAQVNELRSVTGLTEAGRNAAAREINRKYAFEQADLALIQSAANRDYISAQAMADKRIELQLEPIKTALDTLKFVYEDNKDTFSKAEDRLFQTKISQDERAYKEQYDKAKTLQDTKLQLLAKARANEAPSSILSLIQSAETPEDAILAAGTYVNDRPSISTQVIDVGGKKLLINSKTGETIREFGEGETPATQLQLAQSQGNIENVNTLLKDKYLTGAVGPNPLGRLNVIGGITGGTTNFVAGVEQLRSQLSLDSLINAKARGATFGALSEGELNILSNSASKLGTWALKDSNGDVIGYKTSESNFKRELDKINNFAKLDYILKGGAPEDVNAKVLDDGTIWTANSDGTYTQLQ